MPRCVSVTPPTSADDQWAIIEPLIPVNSTGRPRTNDMREVLNTIFYLNRSGCQWDMLPHDLPAKSTVYDYFKQWKADGTWQSILDSPPPAGPHRRRSRPQPQRRQYRQPDGQGDRDRPMDGDSMGAS